MGLREKIIIFAVLPWFLAIVLIVLIAMPTANGIMERNTELTAKKGELEKVDSNLSAQKNVKALKESIKKYESDLVGFNKQFPETDMYEPFYVDLQSVVNETDLRLEKIAISKEKAYKFPKTFFEDVFAGEPDLAPKESKKKKKKKKAGKKKQQPISVSTRTVKLDVTGSYQNIVNLLYYFSNYYRYLNLKNITVKQSQKGKAATAEAAEKLKATLTFDLYKYRKNIIIEEEDEKDKKKKKSSKTSEDSSSEEKPANEA